MPKFKLYDPKGIEIGSHEQPLNFDNLVAFVEQNGIEKASAYFECMADLTNKVDAMRTNQRHPGSTVTNTIARVRKSAFQLVEENKISLNFALNTNLFNVSPKAEGHLEALTDFNQQVDRLREKPSRFSDGMVTNSDAKIRKGVFKLFDHNKAILELAEKLGYYQPDKPGNQRVDNARLGQ